MLMSFTLVIVPSKQKSLDDTNKPKSSAWDLGI
jgi:hypothetical protein